MKEAPTHLLVRPQEDQRKVYFTALVRLCDGAPSDNTRTWSGSVVPDDCTCRGCIQALPDWSVQKNLELEQQEQKDAWSVY